MRRRMNSIWTGNPLLLWSELAVKSAEMWMASAQVIHHRTGRMATAGPNPSARDRREFHLMGQEKLEAAGESLQAMTAHMITASQQMGLLVLKQMNMGAGNYLMLAMARGMAESAKASSAIMQRSLSDSSVIGSRFTQTTAEVMQRGLKPVHQRATANAKRLNALGTISATAPVKKGKRRSKQQQLT